MLPTSSLSTNNTTEVFLVLSVSSKANKEVYAQRSQELLEDLRRSPGDSAVVIYLKDVKAIKKLPVGYHAQIQDSWMNYMYEKYGQTNVKVVERGLKNL